MQNCDICGLMTDCDRFFVKDHMNYPHEPTFTHKVEIYFCEVCEIYIKRAQMMANYINAQTQQLVNLAKSNEMYFAQQKKDIESEVAHCVEVKFKQTEVEIMEVLKEFDKRLEEKWKIV